MQRSNRRRSLEMSVPKSKRHITMNCATSAEDFIDEPETDELVDGMRTAAGEATKLLRSIGSPHRLMILCLLMDGEKTVTEISDAIGARQSLTSQHLTHLRLHGLVQAERRGHFAYYSLKHEAAREIVGTLYRHYCADGLSKSEHEA
jgi:DNA-binding transcriptional ArsR family regulator